jgi:plastocyanin
MQSIVEVLNAEHGSSLRLDPEQVYAEVLQEEQQKGSSPPVAEGRAKAARVRTEHGSPHPKEPKWWPGAQPHLEGGDGAAPAEAEEAAPEVVEEPAPAAAEQPAAEAAEQPAAQAAEQPAAEAPVEQPAAASAAQPAAAAGVAQDTRPADQAERPDVSPAPATQQPAASAPVAAAPAAVAEAPPAQGAPTIGVRHGVPTGNRLRPEDAVSTEAQFDGQRAMEQRRKLIDELVATGVPAVTAAQTGRERSPWLSVLYLIVPLLAVIFLVANYGDEEPAPAAPPAENGGGGGEAGVTVVAEGVQFDTDSIELQAQQEASIQFVNEDSVQHNISIYETREDADSPANAIFTGDLITASETTYTFDAPPAGDYVFQCDVHPAMAGDVVVSEAGGEGGSEGGGEGS